MLVLNFCFKILNQDTVIVFSVTFIKYIYIYRCGTFESFDYIRKSIFFERLRCEMASTFIRLLKSTCMQHTQE